MAQIWKCLKNIEAQQKLRYSYKKKCVVKVLMYLQRAFVFLFNGDTDRLVLLRGCISSPCSFLRPRISSIMNEVFLISFIFLIVDLGHNKTLENESLGFFYLLLLLCTWLLNYWFTLIGGNDNGAVNYSFSK